jgi:hypothetical protein
MEFEIKIFVNTSGVPLNSPTPRLNGRIVGGSETDIRGFPYQVCS